MGFYMTLLRFRDLQVKAVLMAPLANPASPACQVCPATTHQFHWTKLANADGAHLDPRVHLVPQAQKAPTESRVSWVFPASQARLAHKAPLVHPDPLAPRVTMASPVPKVNPARTLKEGTRAHLDHRANLEMPDQR